MGRKVSAEGLDAFVVHAGGEDLVVISMPGELSDPHDLTPAEREITREVLAGHSTTAIARLRGRSPRTIANQLAAIYRKLGVSSRAELAAKLFSEDGV